MAWYDFIAIRNLDTSLTDEESESSPPPEPDPADLAPCPAQYYEVFTGIGGGTSTDAEPPGTGEPPETEDISAQLQSWLNAVDQWMPDEEKWINDSIAFSESEGARGDLPAPIPPQLPDLVDFVSLPALIAQFGPWGVVIFVGIRVVKRIAEGWIEKKMNPGIGELKAMLQDIRDALKKGLLYNDGDDATLAKAFLFGDGVEGANAAILKAGLLFADTDGKNKGALDRGLLSTQDNVTQGVLKSGLLFTDVFDNKLKGALERGLLKTVTEGEPPVTSVKSVLIDLDAKLEALQYNDQEIDLGPIRIWLRSRIIEY